MKKILMPALAASLLSGCAMFSNQSASTETAYEPPQEPQLAARVVPPAPAPELRHASTGPTGIIPCDEEDGLFALCRRNADLHREQEITLMPATAVKAPQPVQETVPVAAAGED
jgi:hypothetical protein